MEARPTGHLKAWARRIHNLRNWLTLGFIVVAVVAVAVPMAQGWFPGIDPGDIFGAALFVAVVAAHLVHGVLTRNRHPRCPQCGGEWQIAECGPSDNRGHFEGQGTSCPHCGTPI